MPFPILILAQTLLFGVSLYSAGCIPQISTTIEDGNGNTSLRCKDVASNKHTTIWHAWVIHIETMQQDKTVIEIKEVKKKKKKKEVNL